MESVVTEVLRSLWNGLMSFTKSKEATLERFFTEVVEPSFQKLETIHRDYTANLSQLAHLLKTKELPPADLLKWLRDAGLKYRNDREFLRTAETELRSFDYSVLMTRVRQVELQFALSGFVKAVLDYCELTISPNDLSFYRDYEHMLGSMLHALESSSHRPNPKTLAKLFYGADYVGDVLQTLIEMCDKKLPERWMDVSSSYRKLRSVLKYPSTGQKKKT